MKKNLKNSFADIYFLLTYHLLAVVFTFGGFALMSNSDVTTLLDHQTWLRILTKQNVSQAVTVAPVRVLSLPVIEKIIGDVSYIEKGMGERPAINGETLKSGSTIESRGRSTALLTFSGAYQWKLRLVPNSRLNIDELMKVDEQNQKIERSLINLIKGAVYVQVVKKSPEVQMKVKSAHAVYGVRGTKFFVATNANDYSLLTVQEGEVEVENLKTMKLSSAKAGTTFLVLQDGTEKIETSGLHLSDFNWDLNSDEALSPELLDIINSLNPPGSEDNTSSGATDNDPMSVKVLEESLDAAIQAFKNDERELSMKLSQLTVEYAQDEESINKENSHINSDIVCLQKNKVRCNLYSEDILIRRGFPRTFGPPQVIRSLIQDLKLYQIERMETLAKSQALIKELKELSVRRSGVLKVVEEKKRQGVSPENLIPLLNAPEIRLRKL